MRFFYANCAKNRLFSYEYRRITCKKLLCHLACGMGRYTALRKSVEHRASAALLPPDIRKDAGLALTAYQKRIKSLFPHE